MIDTNLVTSTLNKNINRQFLLFYLYIRPDRIKNTKNYMYLYMIGNSGDSDPLFRR